MDWTLSRRVWRDWEGREGKGARQDDWIVRGLYYLPQGPWLKGSSFRRLPTKHPWRKSCAPHNNTTAPGHPHTGNLRSLPPFREFRHTLLLPATRPHGLLKRGLATRGETWRHIQTKKNIWIMRQYTATAVWFPKFSLKQFTDVKESCVLDRFTEAEIVPISLFWSHM